MFGTVESATADSAGDVMGQLNVVRIIQGQPSSQSFRIQMAPSELMKGSGRSPQSVVGVSGLWFLKLVDGAYSVLPLAQGDYTLADASVPLIVSKLPAASGTVEQQLLAILRAWYQSLPSPSPIDDQKLLDSLDHASAGNGLEIAMSLSESASLAQKVLGFAAAIRLGSDSAILAVAQNVAALQGQPKFARITEALAMYYRPNGATSIAPLQGLIALNAGAPGLDAAAGAAL